jgi:hypothetical protein
MTKGVGFSIGISLYLALAVLCLEVPSLLSLGGVFGATLLGPPRCYFGAPAAGSFSPFAQWRLVACHY